MSQKVQELNPSEVAINPAFMRKGGVDKETISELCESFVTRREGGQVHQIQPGIVRSKDNGYEVIAGTHRLVSCQELNKNLGKGEEPFLFNAIVVRDNDLQALETSISENEKRKSTNIFDRAQSMQALLDLGRSQDEVAKLYGCDKSTVSNTLAAGRLPAKLQKMVIAGDMEQDAALLLATVEDTTVRQEIIEHCMEERNFYDEMGARIEKLNAPKEPAKKGKGGKEEAAEPDEEETEKSGARAAKKKAGKSKVKKEDVSRAAKQHSNKSATKRAAATSSTLSRKQLLTHFEALRVDKDNPLPKAAKAILSRVEAFFDGEISVAAFRNSLVKNCLGDSAE